MEQSKMDSIIKVVSKRNNLKGLAEKVEGGYKVMFEDGTEKEVKEATFARHYEVVEGNENAEPAKESAPVDKKEKAAKEPKATKASKEPKAPKATDEKAEAKKAKKAEAKKAERKAASDARKKANAEAKARVEADKKARKEEKAKQAEAKKAEKEAKKKEREAKKAEEANFEPIKFEVGEVEKVSTSKVENANAIRLGYTNAKGEAFDLTIIVDPTSESGVKPVKRGCIVQSEVVVPAVPASEGVDAKPESKETKTLIKCTSMTKAFAEMGMTEEEIGRAKKTVLDIKKNIDGAKAPTDAQLKEELKEVAKEVNELVSK